MDGVVRVEKPASTPLEPATALSTAPIAEKPVATAVEPAAALTPSNTAVETPPAQPAEKKRFDRKKFFLIIAAIIVLLLTAYVAFDTWLTNSRAEAVLSNPSNSSANPSEWSKDDEGQDESAPSADTLSNYVVEASLPRALYIEKLNVAARILPMSVNTDGSLQAPKNIYDAGWYNGSVKPGETGALFIDGHASGPTRQGLFAYLNTLKTGDELQVEKGDGQKLTYRVVHVETVALKDVDMRKALLPYGNVSKALNLMTCTGKWLPLEKTYDQRVLVYTEQV